MRADRIKVMIAAARLPLRRYPSNNQLERTTAHGLIVLSTGLLSMHNEPSRSASVATLSLRAS